MKKAEAERLALLIEECAEVIHIAGKALRHGYDSFHPDYDNVTNRNNLEKELAHVLITVELMAETLDLTPANVTIEQAKKSLKLGQFLHAYENRRVINRISKRRLYDTKIVHPSLLGRKTR